VKVISPEADAKVGEGDCPSRDGLEITTGDGDTLTLESKEFFEKGLGDRSKVAGRDFCSERGLGDMSLNVVGRLFSSVQTSTPKKTAQDSTSELKIRMVSSVLVGTVEFVNLAATTATAAMAVSVSVGVSPEFETSVVLSTR
jgi:hypothetical protein